MIQKCLMNSPIGCLCIEEEDNEITGIYLTENTELSKEEAVQSALLQKAKKQLEEYFAGNRKAFDLPVKLQGTEFQKKVWQALLDIPYGCTCSYKDIAVKIGNPKAVRAVGGANNRNPIMIVVPCHRVIGQNGAMVGFGAGLPVKEFLLTLEKG